MRRGASLILPQNATDKANSHHPLFPRHSYVPPLLNALKWCCKETVLQLDDVCGVIKADFPAQSRLGCGTDWRDQTGSFCTWKGHLAGDLSSHLPWWAREKQDVAEAIARSESRPSLCQKKPWSPVYDNPGVQHIQSLCSWDCGHRCGEKNVLTSCVSLLKFQ